MSETETCSGCNGKGVQYSNKEGVRVTCPVCDGTGKVESKGGGTYY